MGSIAKFIDDHMIEYDWRNNNRWFMIWVSFEELDILFNTTNILERMEYEVLQNCIVSRDSVGIEITEAYHMDEVEKYFPMEN